MSEKFSVFYGIMTKAYAALEQKNKDAYIAAHNELETFLAENKPTDFSLPEAIQIQKGVELADVGRLYFDSGLVQ